MIEKLYDFGNATIGVNVAWLQTTLYYIQIKIKTTLYFRHFVLDTRYK